MEPRPKLPREWPAYLLAMARWRQRQVAERDRQEALARTDRPFDREIDGSSPVARQSA